MKTIETFHIRRFFETRIRQLGPWKQPIIIGLTGYLGLRVWSSAVLLILNFFPPQVIPSNLQVRNDLFFLENNGVLSRLFLAPWYRWDSVYYLELAQNGYSRAFLTVWPPLYSGLIHLGAVLGFAPISAAIILSNLSAIMTLALLFRVSEEENPGLGTSIIKCLVLFPTAFFLVAAYSESLYLLLTIASLWMAHHGRFRWAGFWAALATLTRLQGVMLIVPLLYEGLFNNKQHQENPNQKLKFSVIFEICLFSTIPLLIAVGFSIYIRFGIGAPWPWQTLAAAWGQHTGWPWEGMAGNFTSLIGLRQLTTPINPLAQAVDLGLVIFSMGCLLGISIKNKTIPVSYQIYAWIGLLLLLTKVDNQGLLVSASRYLLSLFPIFMAQAILTKKFNQRFVNLAMVSIGLTSQAILLICFSWWIWIA